MPGIKVLYYNWVDFEETDQRGGGVSVYQRNLIDAARRRGDAVWFLNSGVSYSPFSRRPFIREVKGRRRDVRKFELVNSAILSPGQAAFGQDVAAAPAMEAVFADFLRGHGPFDVVHFNNLEGIPVSFLRLARGHAPRAKVIYSLHNYFAFCPQVNLWFQERAACKDFGGGRKCVNCLVTPVNARGTRRIYQADYCLGKLGIRRPTRLYQALSWFIHGPLRLAYRGARAALLAAVGRYPGPRAQGARTAVILDPAAAARFAGRRRLVVEALNAHADHVLAVSRRVAELAVGFGINPEKVQTLYIGTRFAEPHCGLRFGDCGFKEGPRATLPGPQAEQPGTLRIAYLGYMRRDKGFYFYLKALEKMPAALARRLGLVFAAKVSDERAYRRVKRMAHRFAAVTFYDGYTHAQLPRILSGVDLGVVPVLWEDNLPQVALECVASGIPVLTSDRGGARELLDCPDLVFRAGSYRDFYARLRAVLDDPDLLRTALAGRARLYTPDEHYDRLREGFYRTAVAASSPPGPGPARGKVRAADPGLCPTK